MTIRLRKVALALGAALMAAVAAAQEPAVQGFVHEQSSEDGYVWPTDTAVLKKLDA